MEGCIHWFIALIFICEGYAVDWGIIILLLYRWPVRACITFYDKGLSMRMGYRCLLSHFFLMETTQNRLLQCLWYDNLAFLEVVLIVDRNGFRCLVFCDPLVEIIQ
jgi:hypothetical protein